MDKLVIFGNSGSGKSTLAREYSVRAGLVHFDLDSVAWQAEPPPTRKPLALSWQEIRAFMQQNERWVIEGCYADLLEQVLPHANKIIFLNLPVEACVANARKRPWEPHKYPSKEQQDANLDMLIDWIRQYEERTDTFSKRAHVALFEGFQGQKIQLTDNNRGHTPT